MQMLMNVRFPIEPFNSAVRDGSVGQKLQKILEAIKPVATYFGTGNGRRGGTFVVNVNDPADIPKLAEPFFLTFDAEVQIEPFMTAEEIGRAGLDSLGKEWG